MCQETLGGHLPTITWALLSGRVLEGLEDQTRAQVLTGGTTSRADVARRTMMEARTSTAEERRAGDLDQDTKEEGGATGEEDTEEEEEGTEETGALMSGSAESLEDAEMTGETRFFFSWFHSWRA